MATNQELSVVLRLVPDQFNSELKKSQGALGRLSSFVSSMRVQLVAAGVALFAIAKSTANYGDELAKTSQQVGLSVEALAGLQHAAQLSALTNEQLTTGLGQLAKNMVDASLGTGRRGMRDVGPQPEMGEDFLNHVRLVDKSELLGHTDVRTTMIYTHVLNRGGRGVRSPADALTHGLSPSQL